LFPHTTHTQAHKHTSTIYTLGKCCNQTGYTLECEPFSLLTDKRKLNSLSKSFKKLDCLLLVVDDDDDEGVLDLLDVDDGVDDVDDGAIALPLSFVCCEEVAADNS
jgi:hypothetical protein